MPSDGDFAVSLLPDTTRNDGLRASIRVFDAAEFLGHLVVERLVDPGEERDGCGPEQDAFPMHLVDRPLDDDMCAGFQRKRARLGFELGPGEGAFDIARARVVPLDQVRVVAVHHPDQVRQLGRAVRMQPLSKPGCLALDIDRQIRKTGRYMLLEEAWLDSAGCLKHFLPILCPRK